EVDVATEALLLRRPALVAGPALGVPEAVEPGLTDGADLVVGGGQPLDLLERPVEVAGGREPGRLVGVQGDPGHERVVLRRGRDGRVGGGGGGRGAEPLRRGGPRPVASGTRDLLGGRPRAGRSLPRLSGGQRRTPPAWAARRAWRPRRSPPSSSSRMPRARRP